ncbi:MULTISPECIES: NfeD family protein [unclassified Shimia]|uniref:NfeD family protein n=1 Tax=unclassified Shimia TaxID=2630038 RepID=UPI003102F41D
MADLLTTWWVWLAAALILAILEVLAPGFIFVGFAIGAAFVGFALIGPLQMLSVPMILVIFAALSLAAWLVLRRVFALPKGQVKTFDHDIND